MKFIRTVFAALAAMASLLTIARADIVVDQEQSMIDESAGFLGVGGDSEQKLAQSFTVGVDGDLVGLRLPIMGCGSGDLLLEVRQLVDGKPTGALLRTLRISPEDVPSSYEGFQDFFFLGSLSVSEGDQLAFTVQTVGEDSFCSYATAPVGDTYSRGQGFFDSRPNPPGWVSFKEFPGTHQDLAFATLMDDPTAMGRRTGRCVIPGRIDPATGRPFELPISEFVPACRCFQDAGAREMRCGILHPDFFVIRRIPFPLTLGQPYEEVWQFAPLADLDGPVRITLEGAGFEKPVQMSFPSKGQFTARDLISATKKWSAPRRAGETITVKAMAPKEAMDIPGVAIFEYNMQGAENEFQKRFGLEITIEKDQFGQ